MPEPVVLALVVCDGRCLVSVGRSLVYRFDVDDIGMRNLAIVALTDAGRRVDEVAALFGLTATYVSMLRGRARAQGSAGLVRRRGRPRKLSDRQGRPAPGGAGGGQNQAGVGGVGAPPRPTAQALGPAGEPGPGVVGARSDPAGDRRPARGGPVGDQ